MMLKWLWLSVLVVILDQVSKLAAEHWLAPYQASPVIPSFNLMLAYNRGAAFSFLSGAGGWQRWLFTILAIGVSVLIVLWISRLKPAEKWTAAGLALVLGGAIGNLIDRFAYGHVIDFIQWYYRSFYWPTFNLADSAITLGAVILIIHSLFPHQASDP